MIDRSVPRYLGRILTRDRHPCGSCFQVTEDVVVTAWHVVEGFGDRVLVEPLDLSAPPQEASVVARDPGNDLAALRLTAPWSGRPAELAFDPTPVGTDVVITGFAEVDDPGHRYAWLSAAGTWQGSALRDEQYLGRLTSSGVMKGMSGTAVRRATDDAVIGVVSARFNSDDGWLRDTVWVIPTELVGRLPGTPEWSRWLARGIGARDHFLSRALGQRNRSRNGDLFQGRELALSAVIAELTAPQGLGRPLVVTGAPGAGKSALLGRVIRTLPRQGVAFYARSSTHADFLAACHDLFGSRGDHGLGPLLRLIEDDDRRVIPVVVDALDEALSNESRSNIIASLLELAALPNVRVVVATRPPLVDRLRPGVVIDLSSERYRDPQGVRRYVSGLLAQREGRHPGPAGAAWERYREDVVLRESLARVVADRASGNYLVAALTAYQLSIEQEAIDPSAPGFDPDQIPRGIGEALEKYLDTLAPGDRARTTKLLTALAYARGDGLDDHTWHAFADCLGMTVERKDIDALRASAATDYLLQTTSTATRLFHDALADELKKNREPRRDEGALVDLLVPASGEIGAYARVHAVEHAAAAGRLGEILTNVEFVFRADLDRLRSSLGFALDTPMAQILAMVGRRADDLPAPRRARLLALAAAHLGHESIRQDLGGYCADGFVPRWAQDLGTPHRAIVYRYRGEIFDIAVGRVDGRDVVAATDVFFGRGHLVIWELITGRPLFPPIAMDTVPLDVALGSFDGIEVVAVACMDGTVLVHRAVDGSVISRLSAGPKAVNSVCFANIAGQDAILVGTADGVEGWTGAGGPRLEPLEGSDGSDPVQSVVVRGELLVAGRKGSISTGRLPSLATTEIPISFGSRPARLGYLGRQPIAPAVHYLSAVVEFGSLDYLMVIDASGFAQVIDLSTGERRWSFEMLDTHFAAMAGGVVDGRLIMTVAHGMEQVEIYDVESGRPACSPIVGHGELLSALKIIRIGDRMVLIAGGGGDSEDGERTTGARIWIWDLETQLRSQRRMALRPPGQVVRMGVTRLDRQPIVLATYGSGSGLLGWNGEDGTRLAGLAISSAEFDAGTRFAFSQVGGRSCIAVLNRFHLTVLDLRSGQLLPAWASAPFAFAMATGTVGDTGVVAITGVSHRDLCVVETGRRELLSRTETGHPSAVVVLTMATLVNGESIVITCAQDMNIHVWRAGDGALLGAVPMKFWVRAIAVGVVEGREVLVAGGNEGKISFIDVHTLKPVGRLRQVDADVLAIGFTRRHGSSFALIVAGNHGGLYQGSGSVTVWGLGRTPVDEIDMIAGPTTIAVDHDGTVITNAGGSLCAFQP